MQDNKQTGRFAGNLMAYGASEAAAKASRLIVVVVIARTLDAGQIGLAAAALAAADILKSLTENGVGQRIIAAPQERLKRVCATAQILFWVWCVGLFILQVSIGFALYLSGGSLLLLALILTLAGEYLFMPPGLVQAALAMREGKLRQTAAISAGQTVIANFLSVVLALLWPSALALVLPRLLTAPLWLLAMRRLRPWRADRSQGYEPLKPFLRFGWAVLGVEVLKAARLQADKLVIGMMMGAEALGLYFLAFNAGLGLANSFSMAFSTVLFPHLCAARDRVLALRQAMMLSLGLIVPVVLLQAALAPWYVPILFGDGWEGISPVVAILCLVAIPTTLWSSAAGWLRAHERPQTELLVTFLLTLALIANTVILAEHGLTAIATGYALITSLVLFTASLPAITTAFGAKLKEV
ncbi:oligosaccharide flippase family protein [Candidatus Halocynthiibacter alkanivorans]|uniref:oligosaccharide flippase family protein n=1 Tax=Candidatus Halocynthiibacter alkanivorans TaxID=2267619 RepID=UPI000DF2C622|nr:oligosaccharide flippase family protein [Candidatus Halocynthiibacter alkanivorans]